MKKTLITFSLAAMLGMAVLMSACGVASKESVKDAVEISNAWTK